MNLSFRNEVKNLEKNLDDFAKEGLRTLILGVRKISKNEWTDWKSKYEKATNLMKDRDEAMWALQAEIEQNFYLIGATAIDDKLQDQVRTQLPRF